MSGIDFTGMPKRNKMYAGANGSKISVIYNGEQYIDRCLNSVLNQTHKLLSRKLDIIDMRDSARILVKEKK